MPADEAGEVQCIAVQHCNASAHLGLLCICINPLVPSAHKSALIDKISILKLLFKLEGIIKKISYERRDYESVDEKSLSKAMSRKTTKKRIQALKG